MIDDKDFVVKSEKQIKILTLLITIFGLLFSGWVLSVLWGWFVVPVFSVSALSLPKAIGVAIVFSLLTQRHIYSDKTPVELLVETTMNRLIHPAFALSVGWIVAQFI